MSFENVNGVYPPFIPPPSGSGRGSLGGPGNMSQSSGSSYSILTNPSAPRSTMENSLFSQLANGSASMTDITLEQALDKVQELAAENMNLRGMYSKTCLKRSLIKMTKIGFHDRLSLNAAFCSTFDH